MSYIDIELSETVLKQLVNGYLSEKLGDIQLEDADVKIEVKSKQNYKAEWETAEFRAKVHKTI